MMSDLERLVTIEDIKRMRINLFHAIDRRDGDAIESMMTENARVTSANDSGNDLSLPGDALQLTLDLTGRTAFSAYIRKNTGTGPLIHIATMPQITITGADRAHGFWLVEGYSAFARQQLGISGIGYETIEDQYVRIDGRWLVDDLKARVKAVIT